MARNEEFEHGRDHEARAEMGAELFKEALQKWGSFNKNRNRDQEHEHDYSDSKNNDTCSTCGSTNPNDSYDKGKD